MACHYVARPLARFLLQGCQRRLPPQLTVRRCASSRGPVVDRSRILEKPSRFNPPSHPSRRVLPRSFPGPRLSEKERLEKQTKQYPHMMPPEGSFMHSFLTDRRVHLFITLGALFFLAAYSMSQSFLHTTIYRDQLPPVSDLWSHPFRTIAEFFRIYKLHVLYESAQVAEKRRLKLEDAAKRKEFLREHGVEPGFLTGTWMDKFGTVEGDQWKAERAAKLNQAVQQDVEGGEGAAATSSPTAASAEALEQAPPREKRKVKMWFGIW